MPKIKFFISPFFLIRYYLYRDIKNFTKTFKPKNNLLDIGCGQKPFENLFENIDYKGIDFKNYSINKDFKKNKPDYFFNKEYLKTNILPFQNKSFFNTVSFQVLEHHSEPEKHISEMIRITKKNGYIIITAPFLYPIHEIPSDYQRYTLYGLKKTINHNKNIKIIKIIPQGSIFSVISMMFSEKLNHFAAKNKFNYIFSIIPAIFLIIFEYFSILIDYIFPDKNFALNYLIIIKKI